jgi:DnaJ-class molecular chaperone
MSNYDLTLEQQEQALDAETACRVCTGHGAAPGSDNVNWLPCTQCGGTGYESSSDTGANQ